MCVFRTYDEEPNRGDALLAFRCPQFGACAGIPSQLVSAVDSPDLVATFAAGADPEPSIYAVTPFGYGNLTRQHAVRVAIYEDRIFYFEQKFFCDRPTEKTVSMTVYDENSVALPTISTPRITCQYPVMEIKDISKTHPENDPNMPYEVLTPMTTSGELLNGTQRNNYTARCVLNDTTLINTSTQRTPHGNEQKHLSLSYSARLSCDYFSLLFSSLATNNVKV